MAKRIAYVTGGMGGIGTAICQRLYTDGLTVVAGCGPNSPRRERWLAEQAALGYTFIASEGNVADWDSTEAAFAKVKKEVGDIDVLVNNAGITRDGVHAAAVARRTAPRRVEGGLVPSWSKDETIAHKTINARVILHPSLSGRIGLVSMPSPRIRRIKPRNLGVAPPRVPGLSLISHSEIHCPQIIR
jgi:NAD(P)-dependent dehydrogenase (short-subunit alcohol dehydrogenase family)